MKPLPPAGYLNMKRDPLHPYAYLSRWYEGLHVSQIGPHHWLLDSDAHTTPREIDYEILKVHPLRSEEEIEPINQQKEF
jgi:hypothetical protein